MKLLEELDKQKIEIKLKVENIGSLITKAAENDDVDNLKILIQENIEIMPYLRSFFEDAFMSALNFKLSII